MFFKKKKRYSDYIIDLGKLKSKGIVSDSERVADASASESGGLGFLGSLASSAETYSSSDTSEALSSDATSYDERDLPLSLRDKIRSMSEKLYKILDRIDLLEHKINRIERRIGMQEEI